MGEEIQQCGGSSFVKYKSVFSPNDKLVLCPCGADVKVFSVSTGLCTQQLRGHKKAVTGVAINHKNKLQAFTSSLDRSIILWDYTDGALLRQYGLEFPIELMLSSTVARTGQLILTKRNPQRDKAWEVVGATIPEKDEDTTCSVLQHAVHHTPRALALGYRGKYVAGIWKKSLRIRVLSKGGSTFKHVCGGGVTLTCVTCHPTEAQVAVGTSDGRIIVWHGVTREGAVQTTSHWHSTAVTALAYSPEGGYLLSGGGECVLVRWDAAMKRPDFLPRLGAAVEHLAVASAGQTYCLGLADNSLQMTSSSLALQTSIQGLTRGHASLHDALPVGLLQDPRSRALVTNGRPGHLQFYSLSDDSQIYNLDIVQQNYISSERPDKPLAFTEISRAAFSASGTWLATVETWADEGYSAERRLKFWAFDAETQGWVLNTSVEYPHEGDVTSLTFTGSDVMVSTGLDAKFLVWRLSDDTDIYRQRECWRCEVGGSYRERACHTAAASRDGSVLALAFSPHVTLWSPVTGELKRTLPCVDEDAAATVKALVFGREDKTKHLLLVASDTSVKVWNLLTLTVLWRRELKVTCVAADPASPHVALFTADNKLVIVRPEALDTVHERRLVSPVTSAVYVVRAWAKDTGAESFKTSQLYFINTAQELLTIAEPQSAEPSDLQVSGGVPETALAVMMRQGTRVAAASLPADTPRDVTRHAKAMVKQVLNSSSHTLPPVTQLCSAFLSNLALTTDSSKQRRSRRVPSTSSSSSEDESEGETISDSEGEGNLATSGEPKTLPTVIEGEEQLKASDPLAWGWLTKAWVTK